MNKQLIKRLLKENSVRDDLTELMSVKISDVKYKGFKKNSQNNFRLEFKVKGDLSLLLPLSLSYLRIGC